jgi:thiol:disulfide interchange protein
MSIKKISLAILSVALAAGLPPAFAQQSSSPSLSQRLSGLLSGSREDELIEPELAFGATAAVVAPDVVAVDLAPAPGYYLYKDKIGFALKDAKGVRISLVTLPEGTEKKDPTFGTTQTYGKPVRAEIALERTPGARSVTLRASYQGCHEKTGVCYPPMSKDLVLALP